ncbi:uncharacterized protein [Rutidosis leptorrhynchoides]|uniref:uncharacterized protein n=1 Tax=Rutidosis leptorrhynchoides TaxID=125765 RepID=UPI003A99A197
MKNFANKHRVDREFGVLDWVYVKLQPHRQVTLRGGKQHKLSPKYYGPFSIIEHVGQVAYKLQLPPNSQIHPILERKLMKRNNRAVIYALVQWVNGSVEDATWEPIEDIMQRFPAFDVLTTDS